MLTLTVSRKQYLSTFPQTTSCLGVRRRLADWASYELACDAGHTELYLQQREMQREAPSKPSSGESRMTMQSSGEHRSTSPKKRFAAGGLLKDPLQQSTTANVRHALALALKQKDHRFYLPERPSCDELACRECILAQLPHNMLCEALAGDMQAVLSVPDEREDSDGSQFHGTLAGTAGQGDVSTSRIELPEPPYCINHTHPSDIA